MTKEEQQQQIKRLQQRLSSLVDEIRAMQLDIKNFKASVAGDMQRAFELIERRGG